MQKEVTKVKTFMQGVEAMLDAIRRGDLDGDIELPDGSHISINPHGMRTGANLSSYYSLDSVNVIDERAIASTLAKGVPVIVLDDQAWYICTRFFPES